MTREEALDEVISDGERWVYYQNLINKIYDDFETKAPKDNRTLKEKKLDWGQM